MSISEHFNFWYWNIGTLPILDWQFAVKHICLRYRNTRYRCWCRISPTLRSMSMPTYVYIFPRYFIMTLVWRLNKVRYACKWFLEILRIRQNIISLQFLRFNKCIFVYLCRPSEARPGRNPPRNWESLLWDGEGRDSKFRLLFLVRCARCRSIWNLQYIEA